MISVKGLHHSYKKNKDYAVKDVSFEIKKGEVFGFLGPSGAGKSTTQKILTGLLELQEGTIMIDGKPLAKNNREFLNSIGVSFEIANVYKKLTGLENLEFHSTLFKGKTEDPLTLLKMVGLEDAARKKAGDYSKGMLQRLVFARSMINNPKIWFLDEPTSGLDPNTASIIKKIIREKQKEGTTIFLTTHNMHIAEELCDRVAFITDGKLELVDTPRNLKIKHGEEIVNIDYIHNGETVSEKLSIKKAEDNMRLRELIKEAQIETMHTQDATLEDIFIRVTGKELI